MTTKTTVTMGKEKQPEKATDISAVKNNAVMAVEAFTDQWAVVNEFAIGVVVMDQRQLRDAMGLRASVDWGDPWPAAEQELLNRGYQWRMLGGQRVMFLRERDDFVQTAWDGEEINET